MNNNLFSLNKLIALFLAGAVLLASLGYASPAAAQSSCGSTYIVQRGDYLVKIARTCGVSYSDLRKANPGITDPSRIYPGQVINIPSAGDPSRIEFAAGGAAAFVQGHLNANSQQTYRLWVAAGQTLEVSASPAAGLSLAITGADGATVKSASGALTFRGALARSQDYHITLAAGNSAVDYRLDVAVPARIQFAAGGSSATLTGTVSADLGQYLILRANKGQTLNVTATPQDKLALSVYGADGVVLTSAAQPASFSGVLPSTQDYILVIKSTGQAQNYTLKVSIPASPSIPVTGDRRYTVQKGDTLNRIAARFETTVNALLRANPDITDRNKISVGQVIYLPGATLTLPNNRVVYIADRGDTLSAISRRFGVTLNALITANPQINNPSLIYIGQRVNIP